ncbi:MAG TPA: YciI family protein [Candidatus Saccharimonadales bacterium]|nr:YciI family protein [Candidatus Saccharimonadales bacterium]
MKANGNYVMGVALLDESERMIGSVMILDYPSRKELDEWMTIEPYVINNVWEKIEITPCKIGPTFLK